MSLTLQINDKPVRDLLKKIEQAGPAARKIAAHAAARETQDHFGKLGGSRHRSGASSNFYARAARGTTGRVQGNDVVVSIDALGIALRRYGGTIKPTGGKKFLAIPDEDNPTAQNNSPRRVGGLHFRRNASGNGGRLTDKAGRVFYWLVKETKHQPDPSVLPTAEDFDRAITPVIQAHLDRM